MKITNLVGFALTAFTFVLLLGGMARADEIFYSVKGTLQGEFKGESIQKGQEKSAPVRKFQYGVVSPRDTASGQATGKRQHGPVVITKAWGASSPQLFQALVNNERLSEVVFDFYVPLRNTMKLDHRIKLTNANVVEIAYATDTAEVKGLHPSFESISFTFQKIEHMDSAGRVTASDEISIP